MNKSLVALIFSGALLTLSIGSVFASSNDMPANTMPMSKILKSLQDNGFQAIWKVEYEDDSYQAEGVDENGHLVKFFVNPETGVVLKDDSREEKEKVSIVEAAQAVEAAGYHHIYEIKHKKHSYKVKAINQDDSTVGLDVDATTGKVSKSKWFY